MAYKSFDNSKQKLRTIWEDSRANSSEIINQINTNTSIENRITKSNLIFQTSVGGFIEMNTDWEDMDVVFVTTEDNPTTTLVKVYVATLNRFPEKLIPFIKSEIVHRASTDNASAIVSNSSLKKVTVIHIEDIENETELKVVEVHNYISFQDTNISQYQARLLMTIFNPRDFQ